MIDSNNQFNKLSRGLLDAVREVMEAKKNKHGHDAVGHEDEDIDNDGDTDMSDKYLHNRRKAIKSAMKKEEVENIDEALDAAARYGQHHAAIKELMKSIDHHVRIHKDDALKHKDYRGKKGVHWGHVGDLAQVHSQLADIHDRLAQQGEYKKSMAESVELDEAPVDGVAAGSMAGDGHLCATKVFHKEWAEGTPIFSQHAEPDADGNIAWYDVMFEHGIEKMVSTDDLEILMSESHERHGKRKMKEDVDQIDELSTDTLQSYRKKARAQGNAIIDKMKMGGGDWSKDQKDTMTLRKRAAGAQASGKRLVKRGESLKTEDLELDEARGRPRKNPLPAGQSDEPEPRQHIMQQLQRAKLSMRGGEHVTFRDGTKHHVAGQHAAKILSKYSGMKPAEKEAFQKKIHSSHSAFKAEL